MLIHLLLHLLLYLSLADAASYNVQIYQTSDCTGAPMAATAVPDACTALPGASSAVFGLTVSSTVAMCTADAESSSGEDNCNTLMAAASQVGIEGCTVNNVGDCFQAPGENIYLRVNKLIWEKTASKSGRRSLCSGYVEGCTAVHECSKTFIGPCDNGTTTASASKYIQSEFKGVAFVDVRSYEACAEPGSGEDPSCQFGEISPDPNRVYRDVESFQKNSFGYAYTMTGMGFGNENVGAYAGIASYLITGESTIRSTTNKLYAWVPGRSSVAVQRGSSNMGAPNGPFDVCISDVVGGKCTNTTREFPRGSCTRTLAQTLSAAQNALSPQGETLYIPPFDSRADKFSIFGFSYSKSSNTEE